MADGRRISLALGPRFGWLGESGMYRTRKLHVDFLCRGWLHA